MLYAGNQIYWREAWPPSYPTNLSPHAKHGGAPGGGVITSGGRPTGRLMRIIVMLLKKLSLSTTVEGIYRNNSLLDAQQSHIIVARIFFNRPKERLTSRKT